MAQSSSESKCPFVADKWTPFKLIEVVDVNHNSKIFRFGLEAKQSLVLPIASCIMTRANCGENGAEVARPYTPISDNSVVGHFDLLIKTYPKGNLSRHIHSLKVGDSLDIKGPFQKIPYKLNMKKQIGMIAGGTGVTPMLQVIREIIKNPNDKTEVSLVFANIAFEDILLKKELDSIVAKHKNVKVHYVLEKPPNNWDGSVGYVTADVVKKHLPAPSADSIVFVCGPPPMMKAISGDKNPDYSQGPVVGILKDLGYNNDTVYKF